MASMRDIRRRIKTVRNIQQITKAMKMVAAARLQKAETRAKAARPYADHMFKVINNLAGSVSSSNHPLLEVREPKRMGLVVITSDRGMAGSYNTNVSRKALEILANYNKEDIKLITVGRKGRTYLYNRGYIPAEEFAMPSSDISIMEAKVIGQKLRRFFIEHEVDTVNVIYNKFVNAVRQITTSVQILPVVPPELEILESPIEYIFEPKPEELFGNLLPKYIDTQIYYAMLESLASEHGARMTAMSSATDNAAEMIEHLTLDLNRARQAAITTELTEIVSGANALS
jgi:F-type H+-transporting ATPase subunit gamma